MTSDSGSQQPTAGGSCPSCGVGQAAAAPCCPDCGRPLAAAAPEADITRWIKAGWALFLSDIPMSIGIALLAVVPGIAFFMLAYFGMFGVIILADSEGDAPRLLAILLGAILALMAVVMALVMPALQAGVYACFLEGIRTGKMSAGNILAGFRNWWSCTWVHWALMAVMFLCLPLMFILVGIPIALAVQSLLWLSLFRIVDSGRGGIEALSFAWGVMRDRVWVLLVYTLVVFMLMNLGATCMYFGALVTMPIGIAVFAAAYESLRRSCFTTSSRGRETA